MAPNYRLRRYVRQIENIEGEDNRYAAIEAEAALRKIRDEYKPQRKKPQTHVS